MLNKEKAGKQRKREGETERETETLMRATPPLSLSLPLKFNKYFSQQNRKYSEKKERKKASVVYHPKKTR